MGIKLVREPGEVAKELNAQAVIIPTDGSEVLDDPHHLRRDQVRGKLLMLQGEVR